jgi:hypothetical protein
MKILLAIVLIAIGAVVFTNGLNRKDSLAGAADKAGTSIANTFDGGGRQPKHIVMMVIGGALVVVGLGVAFRRARPV